jgi:hypothetical protein
MRTIPKRQIIRVLVEFGIFTILFSSMQILYQIILPLICSLLIEIGLNKWENIRLRSKLSDDAIAKMIKNIEEIKKDG